MKTKLTLTHFDGPFGNSRFDEKFFFKTLLGFTLRCYQKPTSEIHADSPGVYTSEKIKFLYNKENSFNMLYY